MNDKITIDVSEFEEFLYLNAERQLLEILYNKLDNYDFRKVLEALWGNGGKEND